MLKELHSLITAGSLATAVERLESARNHAGHASFHEQLSRPELADTLRLMADRWKDDLDTLRTELAHLKDEMEVGA